LWSERIPTGNQVGALGRFAARWLGHDAGLLEERLGLEGERVLAYCDVVVDPGAGGPR
jgi:hypothetical protein